MERLNVAVSQMARSLARGSGLGLLLAGLFLVGWGIFSTERMPCADLAPSECAIAREAARAESSRQVWMGAALLLLGGGILVGVQLYFPAESEGRRQG